MTRTRMIGLGLMAFLLAGGAVVLAQAAAPGGGGGGRRGMGAMGMGGGMGMQNVAEETVMALADLNLAPDFSLTKEEKTKIAAIRAEFKKAEDDYQAAHKAEMAKIGEEMRAARQAQDQEQTRAAATKLRDLRQAGPKAEDVAAKIKDVLTPEQRTQLEAKIKEREDARQKRMEEMRTLMGAPAGGAGAPAAP